MPTVLEWSPTGDPSEFIRLVREALAAGALVVVPGDVGYVVLANPAAPATAQHLEAFAEYPPSLLAYTPDDASSYGLEVPVVAKRLMIRAWPAPLVVGLPAGGATLPTEWSEGVRQRLTADGLLRFRSPDHLLMEAIFPAVYAEGRGIPTLVMETFLPNVEAAIERLGDAVALAVSAGEQKAGRPTVVRTDAEGWRIVEEGEFGAEEVQRLAARIVLFVCTGNTCRSPLAEGLAKKLLADRFGCNQEELPARGFWMLSAGVAAYGGGPASPESADVAAEFGADLLAHRSRPVNPQLLLAADDVIAMTRGHASALAAQFPGIGPQPRLLCGDDDLDDPIGASLDVYRDCAKTILNNLERFLPEWVRP